MRKVNGLLAYAMMMGLSLPAISGMPKPMTEEEKQKAEEHKQFMLNKAEEKRKRRALKRMKHGL